MFKSYPGIDSNIKKLLDNKINKKRQPVIYRGKHNISFFGFEKMHAFDSCKYKTIAQILKKNKVLKDNEYIKAKICSYDTLKELHTKEYLEKLKDVKEVGYIISINLQDILNKVPIVEKITDPAKIMEMFLISKIRYQVGATILAGEIALLYGWCIVLGGGMHHSSSNSGGGWCMFGDIQLSILNLQKQNKAKKFAIVDLDAHQGNGHETDKNDGKLGDKENIFIFDIYNKHNYPNDTAAMKAINIDKGITRSCNDEKYIEILKEGLDELYNNFKPDVLYYNAGTDILKGDPVGRLEISYKTIIQRDEVVFQFCLEKKIPIVYVTSGGYEKRNAELIADSVMNLYKKFDLKKIVSENFQKNVEKKDE